MQYYIIKRADETVGVLLQQNQIKTLLLRNTNENLAIAAVLRQSLEFYKDVSVLARNIEVVHDDIALQPIKQHEQALAKVPMHHYALALFNAHTSLHLKLKDVLYSTL